MLLEQLLNKDRVGFARGFSNWQEAIRSSCAPLLAQGAIEVGYVESIISSVETFGSYIIIAPDIALPHARPDEALIHESCVALLICEEDVVFAEGKTARLFFTLAARDNHSHMQHMVALAQLLDNRPFVEALMQCKNRDDLVALNKHALLQE